MESQPQNPELRINPENFHPSNCMVNVLNITWNTFLFLFSNKMLVVRRGINFTKNVCQSIKQGKP